jgi:serine/threonine protein kinase
VPVAGEVVAGRYEITDLVGSGGMADVHRARDLVLDRFVAVKTLRVHAEGAGARERFVGEARTLARLSHPGLVTVLDAGIDGERPYLVMELVDGPTLSRRIGDIGPFEELEVRALGRQLAGALAHAHAHGVIHRDVKPSNILIHPDGRVVLTDFGIAQLLTDSARHTSTGEVIGSPAYLAPEQVNGETATPAVDIYALGLVLLEATTGRRVYEGPPIEAAIARLTNPPAIPVSVGRDLRTVLQEMTTLDPNLRPSAADVAAALAVPQSSPGLTPGAPTTVSDSATSIMSAPQTIVMTAPVAAGRRRRRGLLIGSVAATVAVAAGLVGLTQLDTDDAVATRSPTLQPSQTPTPSPTRATGVAKAQPVAARTPTAKKAHPPKPHRKAVKHPKPPRHGKAAKPAHGKGGGPGRG